MALVEPSVMLNQIMGKLYNILTNGDDTVPKSEDNFFSWATPGMPIEPTDFEFLSQGLTGVVKKSKLNELRGTGTTGEAPAEGTRLKRRRSPRRCSKPCVPRTRPGCTCRRRTSRDSSISSPTWLAP